MVGSWRVRDLQEGCPTDSTGARGLVSFDPSGSLATRQVDEMVAAWRRGERPRAEDFLALHPELGDEAAVRLIYEEVCLRLEFGLEVDRAEIARRFPQWSEELEVLIECELDLQSGPAPARFPEVGEVLAGFRLLAELGRGVSGQVFLASQPSLANRPVVLKVTPRGRDEHLSLARLQHMNIVPLYSEHVLQARNLQVLCMPYLGGATLAQILELLHHQPPHQRTGKQLIQALDQIQARLPVALPTGGPFRSFLARSSYAAGICSIGACLADGLQYAHDRNLVHMDIKPSNVLLAGDGQPMLLDFHLARGPIAALAPTPAWMGGTPEFMSPEQQRALEAVRNGHTIADSVDGRADIYSLGLLLYDALGGRREVAPTGPPTPLHDCNAQVSLGLSDIIHKCLRSRPRDRYPHAADLAADLRRHLADLPLRGVANRGLVEQWRKWRRRRPYALSRSFILVLSAATIIAAGALIWATYRQRVSDIDAALAEGRAHMKLRRYPEAVAALRRGLAIVHNLPGVGQQKRALEERLTLALRNEKAAELHRLAELLRFRYGITLPSGEEAQWLVDRGRAIWQSRDILARPMNDRGDNNIRRSIVRDMLDVILFWVELRVRLASPADAAEARQEALRVVTEAEASFGPSPSLDRAQRECAEALGQVVASPTSAPAPESAWEHYDLGRLYLRAGKLELASEQFQLGLELRPQDFWLNFYQGLCSYRGRQFDEAVKAFHVCVALSPETAECYYNRALAHQALGNSRLALRDYSRALELNRTLMDAARNRGILLYKQGRLSEAATQLQQALGTASDQVVIGDIHYELALVDLARADRAGTLGHLKAAMERGHKSAANLYERMLPRP
jgi:serine/threonine protein kinase/Tfp pilus assembly protein PilF